MNAQFIIYTVRLSKRAGPVNMVRSCELVYSLLVIYWIPFDIFTVCLSEEHTNLFDMWLHHTNAMKEFKCGVPKNTTFQWNEFFEFRDYDNKTIDSLSSVTPAYTTLKKCERCCGCPNINEACRASVTVNKDIVFRVAWKNGNNFTFISVNATEDILCRCQRPNEDDAQCADALDKEEWDHQD